MSARKLPDIAPCPCGKKHAVAREGLDVHWVVCACGWTGPLRNSERAAILAWNRRSDEAAERRGAMAAVKWLRGDKRTDWRVIAAKVLEEAIERGEVLPAAKPLKGEALVKHLCDLPVVVPAGEGRCKVVPEPWIVSKPGVMGGKPCVRGTRITVETIRAASKDWTISQILEAYPSLTGESLGAALAHIQREDKVRKGRR